VDIHTVWNRIAGRIEFNSTNMPFGIGCVDQTNQLKQETLYYDGKWLGRESDKRLQLELYKNAYSKQ
jgi:hypothetical protein